MTNDEPSPNDLRQTLANNLEKLKQSLGPAKLAEVEAFEKRFHAANVKILDVAYVNGLITEQQYKSCLARGPEFSPVCWIISDFSSRYPGHRMPQNTPLNQSELDEMDAELERLESVSTRIKESRQKLEATLGNFIDKLGPELCASIQAETQRAISEIEVNIERKRVLLGKTSNEADRKPLIEAIATLTLGKTELEMQVESETEYRNIAELMIRNAHTDQPATLGNGDKCGVLTEQKAAFNFVRLFSELSQQAWPVIYSAFQRTYQLKFAVADERLARFHLYVAAMTVHLEAMKNVFPAEQAERIETWVLKCLIDYALEEMNNYRTAFHSPPSVLSPVGAIEVRLVQQWLGEQGFPSVSPLEQVMTIGDRKIGIFLMATMTEILGGFFEVWSWQKINDHFYVVEDETPDFVFFAFKNGQAVKYIRNGEIGIVASCDIEPTTLKPLYRVDFNGTIKPIRESELQLD